jgi:prepilin-type N-terminal cleavage/methylation domain-containing protein
MRYSQLICATYKFLTPQGLSQRQNQGFTILETVIVVVIMGILAAIAAPSWLTFLNTQRLDIAQNQMLDILRQTQDAAKHKNIDYQLSLKQQQQQVQWAIHPSQLDTANLPWNTLGEGVGLSPETTLYQQSDGIYRIRFNHHGEVKGQLGRITLSLNSGGDRKRCVIVSSLLGAVRTGETQPQQANAPCD